MSECKVVGNFNELSIGCMLSVNCSLSSELNNFGCEALSAGAAIGTANVSAYAAEHMHEGPPGRAGCSVTWVRKYDCIEDKLYFIYVRAGRSFSYGGASDYASVGGGENSGGSSKQLIASAQSGPTGIYHSYTQSEGTSLSYGGAPLSFDSGSEQGAKVANQGLGSGAWCLRTFSLEVVPGSVPVATYTFDFAC